MAANTLSALSDSLKRAYPQEFFDVHLNTNAPFFRDVIKAVKNWRLEGEGIYWPFFLQSPQAIGTPGEGAALPTAEVRTEPQGRVRFGQFISTFDISFLLEHIADNDRAGWGAAIKRAVKECTMDLTKHVNRLFAGTHGTGRIGQVNAATSSSTSFVGKLPYGVLLMRPNMYIAIYDDDTGSGSAEDASEKISKIVQSTRTVTIANAQTLDANDHIYVAGSYGQTTVPNGIQGLIDDGTYLTTVHNQSRATYEELKSIVLSGSGTQRDLSEDLLLEAAHGVRQRSGQVVDCLLMNTGQWSKYLKHVRQDRRINVTGKGVPSFDTGYKASEGGYKPQAQFYHSGVAADIYVSEDVSPRTVYGITKDQLRRIENGPMKWLEWGNGNIFQQAVSTTYTTAKTATLAYFANIATPMPAAHFRIDDLNDKELCGAAVGGSDA